MERLSHRRNVIGRHAPRIVNGILLEIGVHVQSHVGAGDRNKLEQLG